MTVLDEVVDRLRHLGNAVRLQGRPLSAKKPVDKELLAWNNTTKKWEPTTGAQILVARATSNLTLTTSAQSIVGDGDSTKVRLILPTVGDWFVEATCDFVVSATGTDGLIGELEVDDSGSAESGFVILDDVGNNIGATVSQRWKVTTTAVDTPIELKARKATDAGTGTAHQPHTLLAATIGLGGATAGYTDAQAVAAVEGEATLDLTGLIKILLNNTTVQTDAEYIRGAATGGDIHIDVRDSLYFNIDTNSNSSNAGVIVRANGGSTDLFRVGELGTIFIRERVGSDLDVDDFGQLWVLTATPNELYFTDDLGNDVKIGANGLDAHAEAHGPAQHTTGNADKALYLASSGDEQEVSLVAGGSATLMDRFFRSSSATGAPDFTEIEQSISITIENPAADDNITIKHFNFGVTIREVHAIVIGSGSDQVDFNLYMDATRTTESTKVFSSDKQLGDGTTMTRYTPDTAAIAADDIFFIDLSAVTGSPTEFHATIRFTTT